jgi:hypothetical protein
MSYASDIIDLRRCKAIASGCCSGLVGPQGPQGPQGPGVPPLYGSFISLTTQSTIQNTLNPNSKAITYDSRTAGTINVAGSIFPNSQIVIPISGTYRVFFSAQADSVLGIHYIEIFPVINGTSVPNSNTRIEQNAGIESCLTVEYFLDLDANDILELRMTGDNSASASNARLLYVPAAAGNPVAIPAIPSIIITILRIA